MSVLTCPRSSFSFNNEKKLKKKQHQTPLTVLLSSYTFSVSSPSYPHLLPKLSLCFLTFYSLFKPLKSGSYPARKLLSRVIGDFQVTKSNGQFSDLIFCDFSVASDILEPSLPPLMFPFSSTHLLKACSSDSFSHPIYQWLSKSHEFCLLDICGNYPLFPLLLLLLQASITSHLNLCKQLWASLPVWTPIQPPIHLPYPTPVSLASFLFLKYNKLLPTHYSICLEYSHQQTHDFKSWSEFLYSLYPMGALPEHSMLTLSTQYSTTCLPHKLHEGGEHVSLGSCSSCGTMHHPQPSKVSNT